MFKIAHHSIYNHPVPDNHKFPMEKYDLIPQQLIREAVVEESSFFTPSSLDLSYLNGVHKAEYIENLLQLKLNAREQRVSGFKHNQQLIDRELTIMEGTRKASEHALKDGISFNIAGGTHHAFSERAEGFCLLNDHAITANFLLKKKLAQRVLIIDLDVHQGNGTAEIFQNKDSVFTFSMHGKNNYPFRKEKSDLDIELDDNTSDSDYLEKLNLNLKSIFNNFDPDFILYQSGVDILETDKLGKLNISIEGCMERDNIVLENSFRRNIPLVSSMGGGYSPEIKHIITAHTNLFKIASKLY